MLHSKFQEPRPSNSGDFKVFHFQTQDLHRRAILDPRGHHLNKLGRGPLDIPNMKVQGLVVSEKMSFKANC